MEAEMTTCPRCESTDQKFVRQLRPTGRGEWESFIRCGMCRWEHVYGPSTPSIEAARRQLAKINATVKNEQRQRGAVQDSTRRMQSRSAARLRDMVVELKRRTDARSRALSDS